MNRLALAPGCRVRHGDDTLVISAATQLDSVLLRDEAGLAREVRTSELQPLEASRSEKPTQLDLAWLKEEHNEAWHAAQFRLEVIRPVLDRTVRTSAMVRQRALETGVSYTTIYRWIGKYEVDRQLHSLVPERTRSTKGISQLPQAIEAILQSVIDAFYLTALAPSIADTYLEVQRRCRNAKLNPPSYGTLRNRIRQIDPKTREERRGKRKRARDLYEPKPGQYTEAERPFAVVQIDHSVMNVMIVDGLTRLAIGRPSITVAIDVFSRVIVGFDISLDPPGTDSTAMCMARTICSKESYLSGLQSDAQWPVWGVPRTLHADNAGEFHGEALRLGCEEFGIAIQFRRLKQPEYGAHIERYLGSLSTATNRLQGTTKSNVAQRGEYDSEGNAIFTLDEIEKWLIEEINRYHISPHSGLGGQTPIKRYEEGLRGPSYHGLALPDRYVDEKSVYLAFMPVARRTIRREGVVIEYIRYYSPLLANYCGRSNKRQIFRYNKRDLSAIYFFDKDSERYIDIPYSNIGRTSISYWEQSAAVRKLKEDGRKDIDEDAIFGVIERQRAIEANAERETKRVRRERERRTRHSLITAVPAAISFNGDVENAEIKPYDELEL